MSDFPKTAYPFGPKCFLSSFDDIIGDVTNILASSANTSRAWPTANRAILMPVYIMERVKVTGFGWHNGATASGNVDACIMDYSGNNLVSTGSVAQAGVSAIQVADCTDTYIDPGAYLIGIAASAITTTFQMGLWSNQICRMCGMKQSDVGALPISATETLASPGQAQVPLVSASTLPATGL